MNVFGIGRLQTRRIGAAVSAILLAALCNVPALADSVGPGNGDSPPKPEKLPVEAFGKLPFMDEPKLSPNGDLVAARINNHGASILAVLHILEKGRQPTLIPSEKYDLRWYRWAGNDRLLIGLGVKFHAYYEYGYMTRLAVYDLVKNEIRYVGMKEEGLVGDDVVHVAKDGSFILLSVAKTVGSYPGVYRVDLASDEMVKILSPRSPIDGWLADSAGVVKLGFGYEFDRMKWIYRDSEDQDFKTVAKVDLDDSVGDFDVIKFSTLINRGFVLSNSRTGRFGVYEFDWKTFQMGKPVFEHPTVDVDNAWMSEDGRQIEAVFYTDDRERVEWLEPGMKEVQTEIDDALQGRMNRVTSMSKDRSRFIVWTATADDPGHYYYFARNTGAMNRLATPYEALKGKQLAPVRPVTYRSRDGLEIPSYLTLPVGRPPTGLPLIVMPHGGPFARDTWHYDPWVQFLANRGYAVLQPNFRGSTGYGKEYVARGFGQYGTGMQDDVADGVQWLIKEGVADPARVCIMGASFGGYSAMLGAIKSPALYRCAISFAGVTDVKDMLRYDRDFLSRGRYKQYRRRIEGDEEVDLRTISPVSIAADLAIPLLLVHGTTDGTVPFRQAEKMARALKKAKKLFEFVEMKDVGHGFYTDADQTRFLGAVDAFLAKHNPAD